MGLPAQKWIIRNGLVVPKRQIERPRRSRIARANLILGYRAREFMPVFEPARATIAVDATGSLINNATGTSFTYTGITVGSSRNNVVLLVWLTFLAAPSGVTVTWDSGGAGGSPQTMTILVGNAQCGIYGVVNPNPGNRTLSVSWTTSTSSNVFAQSYSGVLQAGGTGTWPNGNFASASSSAPSVAVTSATSHLPVAILLCGSAANVNSVNNTQLYLTNTAPHGAGQSATGAASVTFSAVLSGSATWLISGVDMVPAIVGKTIQTNQALQRAANW